MTIVVGKGHGADAKKLRLIRRAQAALDCHVPVTQAASWSGLSEKTVAGIRALGRWDSVPRRRRPSLRVRLRTLRVLGHKHIPSDYLRRSAWQRLALLQGLMDTDGSVSRDGRCEITLKENQLARDLGDLLSGLGFKWRCHRRYVERDGRKFGPYLRYHFTACAEFPVFRLARKRESFAAASQ